ncbi:MAG: DNA-3-methyladenine glycosylase I, partial [Candidatus Neomarinimicrobiota bacterium]
MNNSGQKCITKEFHRSQRAMPVVYEIPSRKTPSTDNEYLEQMTKAIFQAGFSWAVIRNKWQNFRRAFDRFDIDKVADYGLADLDRLVSDPGIVRNRQKIAATVDNARIMKRRMEKHGSFEKY